MSTTSLASKDAKFELGCIGKKQKIIHLHMYLKPNEELLCLDPIWLSRTTHFLQKDKDTNTQLPATPAVSDQDSSEDDDYITKVTPDVVTKAGRRIKIPNRLDL
ncbi:hypothetical protein HNY73_023045 [Argiope bruennichi]|uniref:Uncharacterized protein n=1 Tax=Argiope bruennichi TaxID=94029 RepID=A0A8T0E454_ARGBR|nr:hypothetical protein HNY73_023045 [Argiope bruennichi]